MTDKELIEFFERELNKGILKWKEREYAERGIALMRAGLAAGTDGEVGSMTDKKLALATLAAIAEGDNVPLDALEILERVVRSAPEQPPPGSVEVRVAAARHDEVCEWHVRTEAIDCLTPMSEALEAVGYHDRDVTHHGIVTAWIPPVATPEVTGKVE